MGVAGVLMRKPLRLRASLTVGRLLWHDDVRCVITGYNNAFCVVWHTDNAELNQRLSEQRARTVSTILAQAGLQPILKEDATVAVQPFMPFTPNYKTSKKQSEKIQSIANTFDGETNVLCRVFAVDASKSPVSCMDIVFDKRTLRTSKNPYPSQYILASSRKNH